MTLFDILLLLLIAAVVGFIAQSLIGYRGGSLLVTIALGFIGAVVGIWLARRLGSIQRPRGRRGPTATTSGEYSGPTFISCRPRHPSGSVDETRSRSSPKSNSRSSRD